MSIRKKDCRIVWRAAAATVRATNVQMLQRRRKGNREVGEKPIGQERNKDEKLNRKERREKRREGKRRVQKGREEKRREEKRREEKRREEKRREENSVAGVHGRHVVQNVGELVCVPCSECTEQALLVRGHLSYDRSVPTLAARLAAWLPTSLLP